MIKRLVEFISEGMVEFLQLDTSKLAEPTPNLVSMLASMVYVISNGFVMGSVI